MADVKSAGESDARKKNAGQFVLNILNGTTIAIVVALIPNAILATFLKPFPDCAPLMEFLHVIVAFQFLTPAMAGFLIAHQFKFNPIQMATVSGAVFIGSGAWRFVPAATVGEKNSSALPNFWYRRHHQRYDLCRAYRVSCSGNW